MLLVVEQPVGRLKVGRLVKGQYGVKDTSGREFHVRLRANFGDVLPAISGIWTDSWGDEAQLCNDTF